MYRAVTAVGWDVTADFVFVDPSETHKYRGYYEDSSYHAKKGFTEVCVSDALGTVYSFSHLPSLCPQ